MIEDKAGTPNNFIVLRKEVVENQNLTTSEKLVYARICTFDEYFESCEGAAQVLGISPITVRHAKQKLVKMGYIEELENTGRGKRYKACYDLRVTKKVTQSDQKSHSDGLNKSLRVTKKVTIYNKYNKDKIKYSMSSPTKSEPTCELEAYKLAEKLYQLILKNKPDRKINKNWKENWARELSLAHRVDGRSWEKLERAIEYSQKDDFWKRNILSGEKVRKQFDYLDFERDKKTTSERVFIKLS